MSNQAILRPNSMYPHISNQEIEALAEHLIRTGDLDPGDILIFDGEHFYDAVLYTSLIMMWNKCVNIDTQPWSNFPKWALDIYERASDDESQRPDNSKDFIWGESDVYQKPFPKRSVSTLM